MHPTSRQVLLALTAAVMVGGCTSDEWPPIDDDGEASTTAAGTTGAEIDGVFLRVFEPEAASIHLIGERLPLIAEVQDAAGLPTMFDDVFWFADTVEYTLADTAMAETTLEPGVHEITALVDLPDGDRLVTTVGGVRVQSGLTGQYFGDASLILTVDFMGTALSPGCRGPFEFTIDVEGKDFMAVGGTCTLDVILAQFDVSYTATATIDGRRLEGEIVYSFLGLFDVPLPFSGSIVDGQFDATFAGMLNIPLIGSSLAGGNLRTTRVSPYPDPPE